MAYIYLGEMGEYSKKMAICPLHQVERKVKKAMKAIVILNSGKVKFKVFEMKCSLTVAVLSTEDVDPSLVQGNVLNDQIFFSSDRPFFSTSHLFLQIQTQCMYLSFRTGFEQTQIRICYSNIWLVGGAAIQMNMCCVRVQARCISWHKTGAFFLDEPLMRWRTMHPCPSSFAFSNYNYQELSNQEETSTLSQRAVTRNLNEVCTL